MALDIPTGINGDSGAVLGVAVVADLTTTFVGVKPGLLLGEGLAHTGTLLFAGLDIPDSCYDKEASMLRRIELDGLRDVLPKRARDAHKGSHGHVLLVAGGRGMPGAARLCGEAALRAGAGLVSLATHPSHSAEIAASRPELICHPLESTAQLEPLLAQATVVAVGPGLGQSDWANELFAAVMRTELPLVVDADALNLLSANPQRRDNWVLTPHPGEAARLLGSSPGDVQADRPAALLALQERYGGTVVLKGAGTLVSSQSGAPWICLRGNPGMASAGMGDVLTGIIAGLAAQGLALEQAATYGAEVHAAAGDAAAVDGERGMLATDLLFELRSWLNP
jgi:NAD(P)H-hydrate epimerase